MTKKTQTRSANNQNENEAPPVDDNALIHNQLLLASTVTSLNRNEQSSLASQVINVSLLHLNEFNAEYEYELSQNSMPIELLDSERKLLKARQNLLAVIEQNSK
ncbi:hypothetical protein M9Y10_034205 [Tritrichomonas musculus]|uniref:Uncharacterized protein n=1 Tax=Tritrichomonas musculus TaxID=1915356 RepID=A0ABR2KF52_9EUKA